MTADVTRLTTSLAERCQVTRRLGAGGMATVYLAHDRKHGRDVAIKVVHPDHAGAPGDRGATALPVGRVVPRRCRFLAPSVLLLMSVGSVEAQTRPPEVAVAPFAVERDSAGSIRAVADKCLDALVAGLKAKGVEVARHAALPEEDLKAASPALLAVLGKFSRKEGQYSGELQLLEVASGEELRSYFIIVKDPAAAAKSCEAAAGRIAAVLQEQKAEQR